MAAAWCYHAAIMLEMLELIGQKNEYLSTKEVAELFNVTIMTVSRWIKNGQLPNSYKNKLAPGKPWRIPKAAVIELAKSVLE